MRNNSDDQVLLPPSPTGKQFSGLENPGATCYMNSLLQTLYMTPEFRQKLYQFPFDEAKHGPAAYCIPYQLQLLFGRLQVSKLSQVETKGLITSFQWDLTETLQQHDAQEFCRVLFDAIEVSLRDIPHLAHMIPDLYAGSLLDYVKCQRCGHTSSREDRFLDLSLTVRSDGDKVQHRSVEQALRSFFRPEQLSSDNQVFCDKCASKGNALKGFRLQTLPTVLMLQLKRFDLDLRAMQRRKLNDFVSFPEVLNMNPFFLEEEPPQSDSSGARDSRVEPALLSDRDVSVLVLDESQLRDLLDQQNEARKARCEELSAEYLKQGPEVFELFSVMVHSGSAQGGHYFAFIKSFDTGRWYNFDDCKVTEVEERDVWKAFGGSDLNAGTNAYLLMYRRIAPGALTTVPDRDVPLAVLLKVEQECIEIREMMLESQFVYHVLFDGSTQTVAMPRKHTLRQLKQKAMEAFRIAGNESQYRLLRYLPEQSLTFDTPEPSAEVELEYFHVMPFSDTLLLEPANPLEFDAHCFRVSAEFLSVSGEKKSAQFALNKQALVSELLTQLVQAFELPTGARLSLYRQSPIQTLATVGGNLAEHQDKALYDVGLFDGSHVFTEEVVSPLKHPRWPDLLAQRANRRVLRFNAPPKDEFSRILIADKDDKLTDVKEKIAAALGLSTGEFYLRKHSSEGEELRNLEYSVEDASLVSGSCLFVVCGQPLSPNSCRLCLDFATPASSEEDEPWYAFTPLCSMVCPLSDIVADVRQRAAERLSEMVATPIAPASINLRQRYGDRPGRAFADSLQLKECARWMRRRLSVHILHESYSSATEHSVPLSFRLWTPATFHLSAPVDLAVARVMSHRELGELLSKATQLASVLVCRVTFPRCFSRLELWREVWHALDSESQLLTDSPLFIGDHGGFMVVRDAQSELRAPTEEEVRKYEKRVPYSPPKKQATTREKSVRIRVRDSKSL